MRRSYFYVILTLSVTFLFLFYQNLDELSQDETPTPVYFPKFLSNVYQEKASPGYLQTERDYERLITNTPLYNQLTNELEGQFEDPRSLPSCVGNANCKVQPNKTDENWRVKFDPIKTLATVYMFDRWQGQLHFNGSTTEFLFKKNMSQASELKFSVNPGSQAGNLSLDLKW